MYLYVPAKKPASLLFVLICSIQKSSIHDAYHASPPVRLAHLQINSLQFYLTREILPLNFRVREAHLWYVRMLLARKLLLDLSRIVSKVA